jgi:flagellar L-ring protein precursor FlgH
MKQHLSSTTLALIVSAAALTGGTSQAQSLFMKAKQTGTYRGLTEDNTARNVGDILTVVIAESHKVQNQDKTERSTDSQLAASIEAFDIKPSTFGDILPDFDIRSSRSHNGQAKQNRDSQVTARIAVVVKDRLPNGNLVVVGKRTIVVDDEEKILQISGVIRIADIKTDNTIESDQVAEAKVSIKGSGKNTESVTRGPIGQIIETAFWLIWPF